MNITNLLIFMSIGQITSTDNFFFVLFIFFFETIFFNLKKISHRLSHDI